MASSHTNAKAQHQQDVSDGKREEKEFYQYYQPFSSRNNADGSPNETHRSSLDRALTAFAQLGAFRLNARRCLISFFDRKTQYIIAEATRTLSLQSGLPDGPGDQLWLGTRSVKRDGGICQYTVQLPMMYENEEAGNFTDVTVAVVKDLTKDTRFCDAPYVRNGPKARFYAGVPIRSPSGLNLGSYCILDDAPRDGLSSEEVAFMKDMATTVMMHLEMVRAREEKKRGESMVRGLGSFVEGRDSLWQWRVQPNVRRKQDEGRQSWYEQQYAMQRLQGMSSKLPDTANTTDAKRDRFSQLKKESSRDDGERLELERESSHGSIQPLHQDPKVSSQTTNKQDQALPLDVKTTFARAANIIRESIEVEGAILYDASVGVFGGLIDKEAHSRTPSEASGSDVHPLDAGHTSQSSDSDIQGKKKQQREKDAKCCKVLGYSVESRSCLKGDPPPECHAAMTEGFLRSLLSRYPSGQVFRFDEPGHSPSDLFESGQPTPTEFQGPAAASPTQPEISPKRLRPRGPRHSSSGSRRLRTNEIKTIRNLFPGVRSLALVPLWDTHRERFYAGLIAWSVDPIRVLSVDSELNYLAAFGDSIMAEVGRIEAKIADKAKADFISSISHELRSPLHGILGSVECLQDTTIDALQENMVHTIETCGKTLLDCIDHLLDFAKVNNFTRGSGGAKGGHSTTRTDGKLSKKQLSLDVDVDLSVIIEEVLETVYAGYEYSKLAAVGEDNTGARNPASSARFAMNAIKVPGQDVNPGVTVIVDIDKARGSHWIFRTQAGAWRRIIMNLFGNSLKYTDEGYIHVKLQAIPLPPKHQTGRSEVTLSVIDSGRGMSQDYLEHRLFVPFVQEDSLAPGTGLGLSIIKQIVLAMGGTIDVTSVKGGGTETTVKIVMTHSPLSQESLEQHVVATTQKRLEGLKIGFAGFGPDEDEPAYEPRDPRKGKYLFMDSFRKLCVNWFDLDMHFIKNIDEEEADIYFTTEEGSKGVENRHLEHSNQSGKKLSSRPLLVMCEAASTAQALTASHGSQSEEVVDYISQPCGPRKFAKALMLGLERSKASKEGRVSLPTPRQALSLPTRNSEIRSSKKSVSSGSSDGQDPAGSQEHEKTGSPSPARGSESSNTLDSQPDRNDDRDRSYSVLLVDDNKINLQLLVTYMKKNNHHYATATNGLEAYQVYEAATTSTGDNALGGIDDKHATRNLGFDYVLMDLSMPVMGGLESTRRIRAHEKAMQAKGVHLKPVKVIALTGLGSTEAQQEAFSSGIDMFLTKPVKLKELAKIMDNGKDD